MFGRNESQCCCAHEVEWDHGDTRRAVEEMNERNRQEAERRAAMTQAERDHEDAERARKDKEFNDAIIKSMRQSMNAVLEQMLAAQDAAKGAI